MLLLFYLQVVKSCFKNRIETWVFINRFDVCSTDPEEFLLTTKQKLIPVLINKLREYINFKFNMELFAVYVKTTCEKDDDDDDDEMYDLKSFNTKMVTILAATDLDTTYQDMSQIIITKMSEFQERDSGWSLVYISHIEINVNKYSPLGGSSFIALNKKIQNKKACININNDDEYCFKWAVISALVQPEAHASRMSSYGIEDITASVIELPNQNCVNFSGLAFPLKVSDIAIFEKNNPNISVNVFGVDDIDQETIIGPFYCTQKEKTVHINLLLLQQEDRKHYLWIKNISRLLRSQFTSDYHGEFLLCNQCLLKFTSTEQFNIHHSECNRMVTIMPSLENSKISFTHYEREIKVPFVIYADSECILQDVNTCFSAPDTSTTTNIQEHIPCAFAYYIKCTHNSNLDILRVYSGIDSAEKFVKGLVDDIRQLYQNVIMKPKPMNPVTADQIKFLEETTVCSICKKDFKNGDEIVIDHCHFTGDMRGKAHNICNLNYRIPKFFPIFFHNFSGYDCHLFIKALSAIEGDINVIPQNKELYITLSKRISVGITDVNNQSVTVELRFLDSFRFMSSSLENLAKNLSDTKDYECTWNYFKNKQKFSLAIQKGILPYEYLNSWERLDETDLPPKVSFNSRLTNSECSTEEYEHAKKVWITFQCKTIWDYLKVYLITDVLLLTDVFENFRKICYNIYKLDPCRYYTAPGLSFDSMLKYTNIELELLTDINMHTFIKRGIRGGITQCSHRHSIANNKYMGDMYNSNKPTSYLMYLDVNNLYGWAMSQPLPYGDFKWVMPDELNNFSNKLQEISANADVGYILEVDLEYPEQLHDSHNDLPFCAENKCSLNSKIPKLIPDLNYKTKYIIHYRNLQQCLSQGLKLKKIYRVLQFKQSCWLKTYIDLNTQYRAKAKNDFEKNFFKLMNNSVYGKTMENVDKRKDVKIVTEWENRGRRLGARALIAKPNFHSLAHFTPDMVAVQLNRVKTCYDKPIYLGFTILETSKYLMYDFHYSYMKPKYKQNLILNYMDTDSFIYTIFTNDFYDDIRKDVNAYFDTSDYDINNPFNIPCVNKKVVGLMKDENCGRIMCEFIGLRPKMYSIDTLESKVIKKAKGVKRTAVESLNLINYRDCLYKKKIVYKDMYVFRSKMHVIYTQRINKVSLSYLDDKRYIKDDLVSTYAWGHYKISNKRE